MGLITPHLHQKIITKQMAIEIKPALTPNEIEFMRRYEAELLPNKQHLDLGLLAQVAALVGISVCNTCRRNASVSDVMNHYRALKPRYDEYLKNEEEALKAFANVAAEEVYTKYEMSELPEVPIEEVLPTKKKTK